MIKILFILHIAILLGIFLAISMFDNHLKGISKSIDIFLDPKAYKPKSQIAFISLLVDKYSAYENEESVERGVDALIKNCFYKQKIGAFNLSTIDAIANKGKQLVWANMLLMIAVEGIINRLGESMVHSVLIILSGILGLGLIVFQLYKNIDLKKERLFINIQDYLYHTYPNLKAKQKEQQTVSLLLNKMDELKDQIEELEQIKEQALNEKKVDLVEEDIIQLIEYYVSSS